MPKVLPRRKESAERRNLKNVLIHRRFQFRYVFWITFTGLLLISVNSTVFYLYTKENYTLLVDLSPMTEEVKTHLYTELREIITLLTGFSLLFLSLVVGFAFFLSHKTAGPLYHFKRVFEDVRQGNYHARVHLRPKDDFREVADSFNQMMESLEKLLRRDKSLD